MCLYSVARVKEMRGKRRGGEKRKWLFRLLLLLLFPTPLFLFPAVSAVCNGATLIWASFFLFFSGEKRVENTRGRLENKSGCKTHPFPTIGRLLNYLNICLLTIHLPLVAENDLPPSAWRVDGERLLEALLDLWRPDALRVRP